jgi:hypothetical protein
LARKSIARSGLADADVTAQLEPPQLE